MSTKKLARRQADTKKTATVEAAAKKPTPPAPEPDRRLVVIESGGVAVPATEFYEVIWGMEKTSDTIRDRARRLMGEMFFLSLQDRPVARYEWAKLQELLHLVIEDLGAMDGYRHQIHCEAVDPLDVENNVAGWAGHAGYGSVVVKETAS